MTAATTTCPTALRQLEGWLLWKYERVEGEDKPRKVPYYAAGGRRRGTQGGTEDRAKLTTFDEALKHCQRRSADGTRWGLGLALMPEFGITALDFDNCVNDGELSQDVEALVTGTYAEYSPSKKGVRAFLLGDAGNKKSPTTATQYGFETFSSKGFVTFTGNVLPVCELLGAEDVVAPLTDELKALCTARFGRTDSGTTSQGVEVGDDPLMEFEPALGLTPAHITECLDALDPDMSHDEWLHVGMALHHETQGEGFAQWDEWSSKGSKYPGTELLHKRWESFNQQHGRLVTARSLLRMAKEQGAYISTDIATAEEFDVVAQAAAVIEDAKAGTLRFPVTPAGQFSRGKRPTWIVKKLIPEAELVVMFGESGSGKSFVALDIAVAIARGEPWRGLRTQQKRVVYIAAEGGGGVRNRLQAYQIHNGVDFDTLPFGVIHAAPNFLQKTDAVDVAKSIAASGGAGVVIVDTFAQVTPGANENSAEDVGRALAHCKGIHRATGAVVLLVHHSGKDSSKGARGWSGLRAAADAEIEVVRTLTGRSMRVSKQKDAEDTGEWGFDLQVVPIGVDEDGDVIDSCVVIEALPPSRGGAGGKKPMGEWEQKVFNVVSEWAVAQSAGLEIDAILTEVVARSEPPEKGRRDTRKQRARRALLSLCDGDSAPFLLSDDCIEVL